MLDARDPHGPHTRRGFGDETLVTLDHPPCAILSVSPPGDESLTPLDVEVAT
jgi:hypothetical protein